MSNFVVGLIFGIGCGGWIYNYFARHTGNNVKTSLIVAVISGAILGFVFYTLMHMFVHN